MVMAEDMGKMMIGTIMLAAGLIMIFESWSNEITSMLGICLVVFSLIYLVRWMTKAVKHGIETDFNPR